MAIVIDDFLDKCARRSLISDLQSQAQGDKGLATVMVPAQLEQQLHDLLQSGASMPEPWTPVKLQDGESKIAVPARMASGSVGLHQDCLNPLDAGDPGFIAGYIAILYLDGCGSFIMKAGGVEEKVDIMPGRLIMWPNSKCLHGVDAAPGCGRAMLGPMTIDGDGWIQRAHDIHSIHAMDHFRSMAEAAEAKGDDAGVRSALANASAYDYAYGGPGESFSGRLLQEYEKRKAEKAPSVCITLSKESGDGDSILLVGTSISGERLGAVEIEKPHEETFSSIKKKMFKELPEGTSSDICVKLLLPDGTLIADDENRLIAEVFGEASSSSKAPATTK
mmetsp:Transcript_99183/g.172086  ORF Transcript_99183/g.172086 Transcript_99183/m.172086 type:complete len:334 (-) Transcript_99183:41-1042(-)